MIAGLFYISSTCWGLSSSFGNLVVTVYYSVKLEEYVHEHSCLYDSVWNKRLNVCPLLFMFFLFIIASDDHVLFVALLCRPKQMGVSHGHVVDWPTTHAQQETQVAANVCDEVAPVVLVDLPGSCWSPILYRHNIWYHWRHYELSSLTN